MILIGWIDGLKWHRRQAGKWFFATPTIIKFANRVSGKKLRDGRYVKVLGLLDPQRTAGPFDYPEAPEAVVCDFSETKPERLKPWPLLKSPLNCLVYGVQPIFLGEQIKDLKEVLLQTDNAGAPGRFDWDDSPDAPWNRTEESEESS